MIYIIFSVFIIIILFICARYWYLWRKISVQKNEWVAQTKESDTILRSMNACFILINSDLVVIRTNYYDLSGISEEPASSGRVGDLLNCKNAVRSGGGCGAHKNCENCMIRHTIENAFCHKKGFHKLEASMRLLSSDHQQIIPCDVSVSGTYLNNEGHEQMLLTVYDITELKNMQRLLNIEKENAVSAEKLKSAFIANMSHEIRTPLNAIVGFSGILASTEEEEEKQEYVSIIENNNTLLLQLISDILDLSKIEAGTLDLHYSNVEINDLMKDLENMCQLKLKSDAVKLEFVAPEEPCFAHIEKNRLSQLIINLVTNAIKFTIQGSIRFGYKRQNNELYFYVADTGCGIPQDKQKSIFGRFVKLNSFAQGTGLGLSICQTLVEHMGGKIGVESEEGNGSTFWFTLPYKQAETVKKSLPKDIQPIAIEKDKLVILIAEDNESNYKLFESILKYDYHLLHAWDGQEAVNMFKEHNPQIILMDINMPVLDGYEATKEIRKYSAKVPIIAITAFAYASDEQRVMESGFDGYMPKPINARQLKAQLTDIMQKRIVLL